MGAAAVRPGDVYVLQIPGDNGEIKARPCVVLDGAPLPHRPRVVVIIFGCSNTKARAGRGRYVRIEDTARDFAKLGLANATTFHLEDIRFYDGGAPVFSRPPKSRCGAERLIELKELLELRLEEPGQILLLPRIPTEEAKQAAAGYRRSANE